MEYLSLNDGTRFDSEINHLVCKSGYASSKSLKCQKAPKSHSDANEPCTSGYDW